MLQENYFTIAAQLKFERAPFLATESTARFAQENNLNDDNQELKIYPNPSTNYFMVEFAKARTGKLCIYGIDGKIIKQVNIFANEQAKIEISSISNGMYIVKFVDDLSREVKLNKLIIRR